MQTISVSELQTNLGLYLEKVKDGDEIIVEDDNKMIARILPFDENNEEQILVSQGFMTLPKKELPEDFWESDAPEIPLEKIVKAIRGERDEYAKQFNYDLDLIFEDLQKKQKESGRKYVSFSDKKNKDTKKSA